MRLYIKCVIEVVPDGKKEKKGEKKKLSGEQAKQNPREGSIYDRATLEHINVWNVSTGQMTFISH